MLRRSSKALTLLALGLWANGCTGFTFGENRAGEDTYLDDGRPPFVDEDDEYVGDGQGWCVYNGSIAVDDRTETAFTLVTTAMVECSDWEYDTEETKALYAIERDGQTPRRIMDLTDRGDTRILFPQDQVLVMSERDGHDRLSFFDRDSLAPVAELGRSSRYHGTRLSPSRRFVAVADNDQENAPIHLIDTVEHDTVVVEHDGDWLEAMWLHGSDTLVAVVFYDWQGLVLDCQHQSCSLDDVCTPETSARIMTWPLETRSASEIAEGAASFWTHPELDVTVPGACGDALFSFTWVGISPDDRLAAIPVEVPLEDAEQGWNNRLLLVDLESGDVRHVDDAKGPVGFTPDGSTIVSYRYLAGPPTEDGEETVISTLLLIDVETLEEREIPLELIAWGPQFFITRQDNVVVISSPLGDSDLVIHDVDSGTSTTLEAPSWQTLNEFVSRDRASELWLVNAGLFRLDYLTPAIEQIDLDFTPEHINLLPTSDLLVVDDPLRARLVYLDPDSYDEAWDVSLPTP